MTFVFKIKIYLVLKNKYWISNIVNVSTSFSTLIYNTQFIKNDIVKL